MNLSKLCQFNHYSIEEYSMYIFPILRGIYTSKTNPQYMIRFTGTHLINLLFITATYTFYISTQPY